ncbi:RING-H2 finger protein ATL30 [Platanthera zijinensis]|uniref:RING-H2 finger protein ATL30 n=1 Tax=Platanthera zijinensis TaxID=2320716 RepID=A0AAP0BVZ0_9ASPA
MSDSNSPPSGGGGVQKPICTICFEDLKPIVEDLQTLLICGHVFHELCIQQWLEYCPGGKQPTCPVCKQSCSRQNITRLYFQSTGDSTQLYSSLSLQDPANANAQALAEEVKKLEGKLAVLTLTFENQQLHLKKVDEELSAWKQLAKREELRKDELKKEKEYSEQVLYKKMEELSNKTVECTKLQERCWALAKELASLKLATDLNLEEEDMVKLASIGYGSNTENAVDVLTKSLARRNKSYKGLMVQCNILGRSEKLACMKLDMAKEKINKLKVRLQEVEKALEEKENEVLREIKASSKYRPKQVKASYIEENLRCPTMENLAMRQYAMVNSNHITNNKILDQFCKAKSSELQNISSPPDFEESYYVVDLPVNSFNRVDADSIKMISESNVHPTPVFKCENGLADLDAPLISEMKTSSIQNAEAYAYTKVSAGAGYFKVEHDSKDGEEGAPIIIKRKGHDSKDGEKGDPIIIKRKVSREMNMKATAAEQILSDVIPKEVPYFAAKKDAQVCDSPASLGKFFVLFMSFGYFERVLTRSRKTFKGS